MAPKNFAHAECAETVEAVETVVFASFAQRTTYIHTTDGFWPPWQISLFGYWILDTLCDTLTSLALLGWLCKA